MKIKVLSNLHDTNTNERSVEFFIERETGMYNNCNLKYNFLPNEADHLISNDEIQTYAWYKVKPQAVLLFEAIMPMTSSEVDSPVNFEIIKPRIIGIDTRYESNVYLNENHVVYNVVSIDQYHRETVLSPSSYIINTIDTSSLGEKELIVTYSSFTEKYPVYVIEKTKSDLEVLQEKIQIQERMVREAQLRTDAAERNIIVLMDTVAMLFEEFILAMMPPMEP